MVRKLVIVILFLMLFVSMTYSNYDFRFTMDKAIDNETVFYVKHNIFFLDRIAKSVNYIMGEVICVNTKVIIQNYSHSGKIKFVVIDSIDKNQIDVAYKIVNNFQYSKKDLQAIFESTFSEKPIDIGKFENDIINGVRYNKVVKGMTKDDVIKALGYPPAHKTQSLDLNCWRYWLSRYNTYMIYFENGIVTGFKN